jgi:hypothetical protein
VIPSLARKKNYSEFSLNAVVSILNLRFTFIALIMKSCCLVASEFKKPLQKIVQIKTGIISPPLKRFQTETLIMHLSYPFSELSLKLYLQMTITTSGTTDISLHKSKRNFLFGKVEINLNMYKTFEGKILFDSHFY